MTKQSDRLWRDFCYTAIELEERFATEEDCLAYWIEGRLRGEPACALRQQEDLVGARRHPIRMRRLRILDIAGRRNGARKDAQAAEDVVMRSFRNLLAPQWHLSLGAAADHGFRIVQDGVVFAAQAALRTRSPRVGTTRVRC